MARLDGMNLHCTAAEYDILQCMLTQKHGIDSDNSIIHEWMLLIGLNEAEITKRHYTNTNVVVDWHLS